MITFVFTLFFFFLFLSLGFCSSGGLSRVSRSYWSSACVGIRVGNTILELLDLRPGIVRLNSDGQHFLVSIHDRVNDGWKSWVIECQRNGCDGLHRRGKSIQELALLNIKNVRRKALALVINLNDSHAVGERGDVEHVQ